MKPFALSPEQEQQAQALAARIRQAAAKRSSANG